MPDPGLVSEMQHHTGTLTALVGVMGTLIGIFIGAFTGLVWRRLGKVEDRQSDLREKVIPHLITKEDMTDAVAVLERVGMAFVERVEKFMSACREGKCYMALLVKTYHNKHDKEES